MASAAPHSVFLPLFAFLFLAGRQTNSIAEAANILGLFTSQSPSHLIIHMSMAKALADKGHNVTVVTTQKPKISHTNIHVIAIPPTAQWTEAERNLMTEIAGQENTLLNSLNTMRSMLVLIVDVQFAALRDKRFTSLYDSMKFDLVILGHFFNDFQMGVAAKFKCPLILDGSARPMDGFIGNPNEWSYVPNSRIVTKPGEVMDFSQRLHNFFIGLFQLGMKRFMEFHMELYYHRLFLNEDIPTYKDMRRNVSLVFSNSHYSEGPIRPNVPAVVEIGGIQFKEKDKPHPLPKLIRAHLNASIKYGAIYLCLNSNIKNTQVQPDKVTAIFKVLSRLKQTVIWKWDDMENLPGKSNNILYRKWLAQDDILAHPNIKLFITNAVRDSVTESQYHGVPMVALPISGDQTGNANKMVLSGYGLQLNQPGWTESDLRSAVAEVLSNSTYRVNVQRYSRLYRDRPLSAKESVVYWSEYVIRHQGAAHMQSPLVHMNDIQALNLDVLAFVFITLIGSILLLKFLLKYVLSKVCNKSRRRKIKQQ